MPHNSESPNPHHLAEELRKIITTGAAYFAQITAEQAARPLAPDKWSIQQTTGHLIDSATNNLQRVIRLQHTNNLVFPGYQQDAWVITQHYDQELWDELRTLWLALNRHLSHIVQYMDPISLSSVWHIDEDECTLGFIIEDYIAHLRHHLINLPGFSL